MNEEKKVVNLTTPVLVLLIAVAAFLGGSYLTRMKYEKGKAGESAEKATSLSPAPTTEAVQPLSVENLKKYAQELGLDSGKFNDCLDKGKQADKVSKDSELAASVGVQGTPGFFVNGRFLGGAFPFELFKEIIDKELAGKGSSSVTAYSQQLQDAVKQEAFNPKPIEVKINENDPQKGPTDAKVTIVEFSDFQCPYCGRGWKVMGQVEEAYKDQIRFVFKQLPLPFHQFAQKAAEASLCAAEQGKFWEYHDQLFSLQSSS